jgi:aryl-alcohol dehydrogenase-like predicted oxidoreductase
MPQQLDHYRLLGRSGLRLSALSLGTMTFGVGQGWGSDDAQAGQIFNHYVECGGNRALAWTLHHPAVVSPIIGARTVEQLKENLACLQVAFSDEQLARLDAVSRIDPGFPHTLLTSKAMDSMFGYVKVDIPTGKPHV